MIKWIFIIIVGVGAYMHFMSKTNETYLPPDANKIITNIPINQETEVQPAQQAQSREPTEDQCKSVGGRIISGMGCVVGAPANGYTNPNFSPSEVEAICKQDGSRYEPAINSCVSNMTHEPSPAQKYNQETQMQRTLSEPTEKRCRSVGGHIVSGMGCVIGSHEPTEAECTSVNGRMVSGIGCVSNEPPREPTETECTSLGGHFVKDFGCVSN